MSTVDDPVRIGCAHAPPDRRAAAAAPRRWSIGCADVEGVGHRGAPVPRGRVPAVLITVGHRRRCWSTSRRRSSEHVSLVRVPHRHASGRRSFANPHYGILPLLAGTLTITAVALVVAIPLGTIVGDLAQRVRAAHGCARSSSRCSSCSAPCRRSCTATSRCCSSRRCCRSSFPDLPGVQHAQRGAGDGGDDHPVRQLARARTRCTRCRCTCARARTRWARRGCRRRCASSCPSAFSGITAAYILGISRAIGETMVVAIAAGHAAERSRSTRPSRPRRSPRTSCRSACGDLPHGTHRRTSRSSPRGSTLFLMTLVFNIGGYLLRKRYREAY